MLVSRNVSMGPKDDEIPFVLHTGGRRNIATKWMRPGPGIWKSGKFKIHKNTKMKVIEIKIRSAQNVGKVWISRKKQLPAPFGTI